MANAHAAWTSMDAVLALKPTKVRVKTKHCAPPAHMHPDFQKKRSVPAYVKHDQYIAALRAKHDPNSLPDAIARRAQEQEQRFFPETADADEAIPCAKSLPIGRAGEQRHQPVPGRRQQQQQQQRGAPRPPTSPPMVPTEASFTGWAESALAWVAAMRLQLVEEETATAELAETRRFLRGGRAVYQQSKQPTRQ
jgi:hypothetical protein